jgi:5-methylcytosine-specific restriction endonuclease McrBC regulatory subunit McrC
MPLVPGSAKEVPPWVLAGPILQRIGQLLREIRKGFRMHEEVRQSPRGQIMWDRYIRQHVVIGSFHQLPCRFPELGPDLLLQSFLRWGVERVHISLAPFVVTDVIARTLAHEAESLLLTVGNVRARVPDRRSLEQMLVGSALPSDIFRQGLQALSWLVDERGLAGAAELDGLAWAMPMHELFERWVEHIVRLWAHGFGGQVKSAARNETIVPIQWSRRGRTSMGSLSPDLVVQHGQDVYIIDAKYKGHFEELDDHRWAELAEDLRNEHRHDLHQVLAYASVYEAKRIVAVLAYPMFPTTWLRLSQRNQASISAELTHGGRQLQLVLTGLPLKMPAETRPEDLTRQFESMRSESVLR